jgi:hypothetical protein
LTAADRLIRQRQGKAALAVAQMARISGAIAKLMLLGVRRAFVPRNERHREAWWTARGVLRHYLGLSAVVSRRS